MTTDSGFFTLGISPDDYTLPHGKLGLPVILLIRQVLCRAFEQLRADGFDLARAGEDQVTAALHSVIENNLRQRSSVPGFNRQTFERVARQAEVENYNGTKLRTNPDLCFRICKDDLSPTWLSVHDGLFVECKPVDERHPAGSKYCDDGLVRFVDGDYGWAMQEGVMLAYARDGRTIADHLIPAMQQDRYMASLRTTAMATPSGSDAAKAVSGAETVHVSKHDRDFEWPHGKGRACEITVFHLWHDCS